MSASHLVTAVFIALGAVSLLVFVYCTWSDGHENGSGPDGK